MGHLYSDSYTSCIRVRIAAGICAVPTADAVATTEVSLFTPQLYGDDRGIEA